MPRGRRDVTVGIGARSAKLDRELRKARRKFKRFGRDVKQDLGRSFSGVKRSIAGAGLLGGVGGFALASQQVIGFEDRLDRLRIQAGDMSRTELAALRNQIRGLSDDTGLTAESILDGAEKVVELGREETSHLKPLDLQKKIDEILDWLG